MLLKSVSGLFIDLELIAVASTIPDNVYLDKRYWVVFVYSL